MHSVDPYLRKIPLFAGFDDAQLQRLSGEFVVRSYPKNAWIVRQGDRGGSLFVIVSGSAAVVREHDDGRETILSLLKAGQFFGEMSLLDEGPRSATVRTASPAQIAAIERTRFLSLVVENAPMAHALLVALTQRLREANDVIAASTSGDIKSRVATLLLRLVDNFGEPADGGTRISIKLTNLEMANMIGTTRESVNRTLNRFWDERIIDMRTSSIIVVEPDRLRSIAP